jgi:hypothetical protein
MLPPEDGRSKTCTCFGGEIPVRCYRCVGQSVKDMHLLRMMAGENVIVTLPFIEAVEDVHPEYITFNSPRESYC